MLYSIPLLLQSDKDHSQLKTQLPNAGEGVDTDVLTGSKSSRKRLVNYYHFSLGRTENRNYLGACRNNPRYLVFNTKSCFIHYLVKTQVSTVIQRIALFRNYDYGNGRPTFFVFNSATLQLSSQSSFRANIARDRVRERCSCHCRRRRFAIRLAHADRREGRQASKTEVAAAVCNPSLSAHQSQVCIQKNPEGRTRVAQIAR